MADKTDQRIVEEAKRLHQSGWPIKDIAIRLGVSRSRLYYWLDKTPDDTGPVDPNAARSVEDFEDEKHIYADFYADIHVQLLGDPPLHRSALWSRLPDDDPRKRRPGGED